MAQRGWRTQGCGDDGHQLSMNFARTNPLGDDTHEALQTGIPLQSGPAAERHADVWHTSPLASDLGAHVLRAGQLDDDTPSPGPVAAVADAAAVGVVNLPPGHACRRVREELRPRVSPIPKSAPAAAGLKRRRYEAPGNGFRAIDQDQRARVPQEVGIGRDAFDAVRRRSRDRWIARLRAT